MSIHQTFVCPEHLRHLESDGGDGDLRCPSGCLFRMINNIPRFVSEDSYAASFGIQWNEYRITQLDSYTGIPISRDRLQRLIGGSLEIFRGKKVLEAGCGAGRFTEIMLQHGAQVIAVDISSAVDANYQNCARFSDYIVCQADILRLPLRPAQFDLVVCVGVIQHTPSPEKTIEALCSHVKPGGTLVVDHYCRGYGHFNIRRYLRAIFLRTPASVSLKFIKIMTSALWPLHAALWKRRRFRLIRIVRFVFLHLSPLADYHEVYGNLGTDLLKKWAELDTHDMLTDYYKHIRSAEEIQNMLRKCGMTHIETAYAGNGVEARAVKPLLGEECKLCVE